MALAVMSIAHGAITWSGLYGPTEINIPSDFDGIYIDFDNPTDATSYSTDTSEPAEWDLNPFFGGAAVGNSDTFLVATDTGATNSDLVNLAPTVVIGDGSGEGETFVSGFSGSSGHMGTDADQFEGGVSGYLGFQIDDGSGGYYYGWMRVTFEDDGSVGTVHEWAWDTSGAAIQVGVVPEPDMAGMIALAVGILLIVRRRH